VNSTNNEAVHHFVRVFVFLGVGAEAFKMLRLDLLGEISYNKLANGSLHDAVHVHHQGVFYFKNVVRFHGPRAKGSFIHTDERSEAFSVPIFTKLTKADRH
jgi:hypothetical protein